MLCEESTYYAKLRHFLSKSKNLKFINVVQVSSDMENIKIRFLLRIIILRVSTIIKIHLNDNKKVEVTGDVKR